MPKSIYCAIGGDHSTQETFNDIGSFRSGSQRQSWRLRGLARTEQCATVLQECHCRHDSGAEMMITTQQELEQARSDAYALVRARAKVSAGTSAVPALGFDIAADVAILLQLVPAVNRRFGLSAQQIATYDSATRDIIARSRNRAGFSMVGAEITKTLIAYALKKIAGRAVVRQTLKFVPVLGWAANAVIGFRAMKYVGNTHVDDCYRVAAEILAAQVH
jgi:hypothetical protein